MNPAVIEIICRAIDPRYISYPEALQATVRDTARLVCDAIITVDHEIVPRQPAKAPRLFWHTREEWAMVSPEAVAAASPEMVADVLRMALEDIAALWDCAPDKMPVTTRSTTPPVRFRK